MLPPPPPNQPSSSSCCDSPPVVSPLERLLEQMDRMTRMQQSLLEGQVRLNRQLLLLTHELMSKAALSSAMSNNAVPIMNNTSLNIQGMHQTFNPSNSVSHPSNNSSINPTVNPLLDVDQWLNTLLSWTPSTADGENSLARMVPRCVRVLVVEDDAACQRLVASYLARLSNGHLSLHPIPAQDGHEALRLLAAFGTGAPHGIQLVLMDVQLPGGLDGPQAASLIHAAHPSLPIIPMTSLISPADLARYRAAGMVSTVLAKPFSRQGLGQAIIKEIGLDELSE